MTKTEHARLERLGRELHAIGKLAAYAEALRLDRVQLLKHDNVTGVQFCDDRLAIFDPILTGPASNASHHDDA